MTRAANIIEMDGDSGPLSIHIAGHIILIEITGPSDAAFQVTEINPDGDRYVLTAGSEW